MGQDQMQDQEPQIQEPAQEPQIQEPTPEQQARKRQIELAMRVIPDPQYGWEINAHIELEQQNGTMKEIVCGRSTVEVIKTLAQNTKKDDPDQLMLKTRVYVNAVDRTDPDTDKPVRHVMGEGTLGEVVMALTMASVHPQVVTNEFMRLCEFFATRSALKGVILTMVFADACPSGFGYMSGYADVTLGDIGVLGASAQAQTDMFKDKMRKDHPLVRFADDEDKSRIIIPGR